MPDPDSDLDLVAGDEPARGRDDRGLDRVARFRHREQHAQRVGLVEMRKPGRPVAAGKADFDHTVDLRRRGSGTPA